MATFVVVIGAGVGSSAMVPWANGWTEALQCGGTPALPLRFYVVALSMGALQLMGGATPRVDGF